MGHVPHKCPTLFSLFGQQGTPTPGRRVLGRLAEIMNLDLLGTQKALNKQPFPRLIASGRRYNPRGHMVAGDSSKSPPSYPQLLGRTTPVSGTFLRIHTTILALRTPAEWPLRCVIQEGPGVCDSTEHRPPHLNAAERPHLLSSSPSVQGELFTKI